MNVENIYQKKNNNAETIFEFEGGLKVIKRSNDIVEKLNIKKWGVINFIPEDFQRTERPITSEEKKKLKQIREQVEESNNNYFWKRVKNYFSKLFI